MLISAASGMESSTIAAAISLAMATLFIATTFMLRLIHVEPLITVESAAFCISRRRLTWSPVL